MADNISVIIDTFKQNNRKELKLEEGKTGRQMTKYDVAMFMLKNGVLQKADFEKWLKTQEGSLSKTETEKLNKMPLFMAKQQTFGKQSYLDEDSEFSIGNVMGFTKKGETKPIQRKNFNVQKQFEKQKFKQHIQSLPETDKDAITLTREIETEKEQKKLSEMTNSERKDYIMSKFLSAKDKNDREGMMSALGEFYGYECEFLDKKLGISGTK